MKEQASIWLRLAPLVVGLLSLGVGLRVPWSNEAELDAVWRRSVKLGCIVLGIGPVVAGAVNVVTWLLR